MSAAHTPEQIDRALAAFTAVGRELGIIRWPGRAPGCTCEPAPGRIRERNDRRAMHDSGRPLPSPPQTDSGRPGGARTARGAGGSPDRTELAKAEIVAHVQKGDLGVPPDAQPAREVLQRADVAEAPRFRFHGHGDLFLSLRLQGGLHSWQSG
jgi:hypothetical protein